MIKPALQDDAFLQDVLSAPPNHLCFWWLGQSGYLMRWRESFLIVDPYLSDSLTQKYAGTDRPHVRISQRVIDPSKLSFVHIVASTHSHTDHLDADTLIGIKPEKIIAPRGASLQVDLRAAGATPVLMNAGMTCHEADISISAVPAVHGELDALGYVFGLGGYCIYHSGDTTPVDPWPIRQFGIDVAILPINGMLGNMGGGDAARFARDIGAKIVIPCHYDMFEFNTADPYKEFVPKCEQIGQPYRVLKLGERFTYPEQSS